MSELAFDTTLSVVIAYSEHDQRTTASFEWPTAMPEDTYTVDLAPNVSLELDRHFPIRLASIGVQEPDGTCEEALVPFVGEALSAAIAAAPRIGFSVMSLALSPENRKNIAQLQAHSPSTPPVIRRACRYMLRNQNLIE